MTSLQRLQKLRRIIRAVLKSENCSELSAHLVFVSQKKIHALNKTYRGKDRPTDVLSFNEEGEENYLGEVVLCPSYVRAQARELQVPFEKEMIRMAVHGTLHLLGYDHIRPADRRRMLPRQEILVNTFCTRHV